METKWIFVLVTMATTMWRSFNMGYQSQTYAIGAVCNTYFFYLNKDFSQKLLNGLYICTSLIGVYSYY